jgi:hypothetical protein
MTKSQTLNTLSFIATIVTYLVYTILKEVNFVALFFDVLFFGLLFLAIRAIIQLWDENS